MKPAILIIDVLQDFFRQGRLEDHREQLVNATNDLVRIGREKNIPIIWVRQEFEDDLSDAFLAMKKSGEKITIKNTDGCKLLPELEYEEHDYEIVKKRYSAFFGTKLDDLLLQLGVDTLILAGVNTHACVRTAAIDGYQRDYEIVLATDCIDSYDEEFHKDSLRYLSRSIAELMSNSEIESSIT